MSYNTKHSLPAMEIFMLGVIDFEQCLALQQRLVYEISGRDDGQIALLICEHSPTITIGRNGSTAHLPIDQNELATNQIKTHWVNRGGGCVVHAPGQLAIYPIVPLDWYQLSVGEYILRFQTALSSVIADAKINPITNSNSFDIWGRTGQLANLGIAVKSWTTYYGAYLNVSPSVLPFRLNQSARVGKTDMSSLAVERQNPVRMTFIRESLIRHLSTAFECSRYHLYTGHPLLQHLRTLAKNYETTARVG